VELHGDGVSEGVQGVKELSAVEQDVPVADPVQDDGDGRALGIEVDGGHDELEAGPPGGVERGPWMSRRCFLRRERVAALVRKDELFMSGFVRHGERSVIRVFRARSDVLVA